MRVHILKVGLLTIIAAGLASCGGQAGQPLTAQSTQAVVGQLNAILGQLPRTNAAPTMPNGTNLTLAATKPGVSTMAATECETVTPVPPVDGEQPMGDGIALLKTGAFDCVDQVSGGLTYTRKGSYTVKDLDDTVAGVLGGLHVDFNLSKYKYIAGDGAVSDGAYNGFWDYKGDGAGGVTSTSEFSGRNYYKATADNYETDFTYTYTWAWALSPIDPANTWTTGRQSIKGDFTMNGKFANEDRSGSHAVVSGTWKMSYYSKNLVYDQVGCSKYFRSGSIFMDDYNGNLLETRYLCTTVEFYVNGAKSDWYTTQD